MLIDDVQPEIKFLNETILVYTELHPGLIIQRESSYILSLRVYIGNAYSLGNATSTDLSNTNTNHLGNIALNEYSVLKNGLDVLRPLCEKASQDLVEFYKTDLVRDIEVYYIIFGLGVIIVVVSLTFIINIVISINRINIDVLALFGRISQVNLQT